MTEKREELSIKSEVFTGVGCTAPSAIHWKFIGISVFCQTIWQDICSLVALPVAVSRSSWELVSLLWQVTAQALCKLPKSGELNVPWKVVIEKGNFFANLLKLIQPMENVIPCNLVDCGWLAKKNLVWKFKLYQVLCNWKSPGVQECSASNSCHCIKGKDAK